MASEVNAHAGIQVALTVLALAALPISSWLYISNYVEERIDRAITVHDASVQSEVSDINSDMSDVRDYTRQLCREARAQNQSFSCEVRQYRYPYQAYELPGSSNPVVAPRY